MVNLPPRKYIDRTGCRSQIYDDIFLGASLGSKHTRTNNLTNGEHSAAPCWQDVATNVSNDLFFAVGSAKRPVYTMIGAEDMIDGVIVRDMREEIQALP